MLTVGQVGCNSRRPSGKINVTEKGPWPFSSGFGPGDVIAKGMYSQGGCLATFVDPLELDSLEEVPFSVIDWKTRASRRVLHSTFAAESICALETVGYATYTRAYVCEILLGCDRACAVDQYDESHMMTRVYTDCRSLFDHLKKDRAVPEDVHLMRRKRVCVVLLLAGALVGSLVPGPTSCISCHRRLCPSSLQL